MAPWWLGAALLLAAVLGVCVLWASVRTALSVLWLARDVLGTVALQVAVAALLIRLGGLQLSPEALAAAEAGWRVLAQCNATAVGEWVWAWRGGIGA